MQKFVQHWTANAYADVKKNKQHVLQPKKLQTRKSTWKQPHLGDFNKALDQF
jgi:hypothetical protein